MEHLSEQIATVEPDGDHFKAIVSDKWLQGRTAFGGLSAALAARAANLTLPEDQRDRPLRSILVTFAGPINAGEITIETRLIRAGKAVSVVSAEIKTPDGSTSLLLQAIFGGSRETASVEPDATFTGEPLDSAGDTPFVEGIMPGFLRCMQLRWTGGGIPTSNTKGRKAGIWARHRERQQSSRIEEIIAMGDVPPPVMMSHYKHPIRASSVSWSLDFVQQPDQIEGDWFYLDYRMIAAQGGYTQQSGKMFDDKGRLVALSNQCMTFFE